MLGSDTGPLHAFIEMLVEPQTAAAIVDVGCGRGTELLALAGRAPPGARLTGLDVSADMIATARAAVGADLRFTFTVHDAATGLPFPDGAFDRALSVNLLECLPDPHAHLRELHRVLAPGGRVVCAHWDWDSVAVDHDDQALVRRVVHAFADWRQPWMASADGWMGRRLWAIFQRSALFAGAVHPFVHTSTHFEPGTYGWEHLHGLSALVRHGAVTAEEYDRFLAGIQDRARAGTYFFSLTLYAYAGEPL